MKAKENQKSAQDIAKMLFFMKSLHKKNTQKPKK